MKYEPNRAIEECVAGARWWELAGHDPASLAVAWSELHHAVLAAAEVGKALAVARSDGLEACLGWYDGGGLLEGFFGGMTVGDADGPGLRVRSALHVWERKLYVVDERGAVVGELELNGSTREDATMWALDIAMNAIDQPVRNATDAMGDADGWGPDDGIAAGGVFGEPNQLAQAELIRLYANTSAALDACRGVLGIDAWEVGPTVVRSDRFEMTAEFVSLGRDARSSVRVGLCPPRGVGAAARGACWFAVSTDGGAVAQTLAVESVGGLNDAASQAAALGAMLARVLPAGGTGTGPGVGGAR